MADREHWDLHDRSRRIGVWSWCEQQLFGVLGDWATSTPDPTVAVFFGEMARRHAWHSQLFFERLPELASVDAEQLVAAPGRATDALFDAVSAAAGDADSDRGVSTLVRFVAAYRVVLPLLVGEYQTARTTVSVVAEPALGRALDLVLRDDQEEWARAQPLFAGLLTDAHSARSAAEAQLRLELLAVETASLSR
jgi:hypothetical protein